MYNDKMEMVPQFETNEDYCNCKKCQLQKKNYKLASNLNIRSSRLQLAKRLNQALHTAQVPTIDHRGSSDQICC